MATTIELTLAPGVTLSAASGEDVELRGRGGRLTIRRPPPELGAALSALAGGVLSEDALATLAGRSAVVLFYHLESAADLGLLRRIVTQDGCHLLGSSPLSPHFVRHQHSVQDDTPYQLSRFAHSRVDGGETVLECPLSHAVLTVHDRRVAALLFELARPISPRAAAERIADLELAAVRAVFQMLAEAAMLDGGALDGGTGSTAAAAMRQWEFHDLLFHTRSRALRHGRGLGGTYRFAGDIPALPAAREPHGGAVVELFRPEIEALRREDPPFTEVLERRRSIRSRGPRPLSARELGELLFRSARVRELRQSERGEVTSRPYPGAGALYELEIYPVVKTCEGVPAGLYHYCPFKHRLERLSGETAETKALLDAAAAPETPDVLFVLAARFQRIAWKYESIAYSLILKDAGALLQTIYLVATAMSLSPFAIGHGDPELFCRAAGADFFVEGSVAEIAVNGGGGAEGPVGAEP